jgi:hypothetical protein
MILLRGTRGSGKSVWIEEVHRLCSGTRPCARLDLASFAQRRPHEVATDLAYRLSQNAGQFGRLRFPRLLLGLVVIRSDLNRTDHDVARAELRGLLFTTRRRLMTKLRQVSDSLLAEIGAPAPSRTVVGLALDGLDATLTTAHRLRGAAFTWYRNALGHHIPDPFDALIELHGLQAQAVEDTLAQVDATLCDAFLADLRAEFGDGLRARRRTGNCLVLLDNADCPVGEDFLGLLAGARHRHARGHPERHDPLVVVASGRSRFPTSAERGGRQLSVRKSDRASYADWADHRDREESSWFYAVELGDLDHSEVATIARRWPNVASQPDTMAFVERLTHGHPWGADFMLRVAAIATERAGGAQADLRNILDEPDPMRPERTVADAMLDRLLMGAPDELRHALITCSAAADLGRTPRRRALVGHAAATVEALDRFCTCDLWVSVREGKAAAPVMHPFLRRVLLHCLARRKAGTTDDWRAVHGRLRRLYEEVDDSSRAAYHALAGGDLAAATAYLEGRLARDGTRAWLPQLAAVSAAPVMKPGDASTPRDLLQQLVATADDDEILTRLVVARWLSTDPLGDPHHRLDVLIAVELDRLATRVGDDADVLHDEAQRYRQPWPAAATRLRP